ncbi:unnamed protein product [Rotaria magnacalcarata]|uniref:SWIM-type domain-containing protein n=1 Tax=Rotaria magnacalcarata TaxID=392030 RepID=A0A816MLI4_9BILA|nr:unnamed protein product [Rotaria magnacalcarata]CAF4159197.1 unnamed protein product [Rotaria magnacalcarata]
MQNDFAYIDVPTSKNDPQQNEEPMLMEVDTDFVAEDEDIERKKEEKEEEEETKSLELSIWRTSKSHGSCIVCSVTDSKSMRVLSDEQRTMIFLNRGIWIPKDDVEKLIDDFRTALQYAGSLDFDDPGALDNENYKTITGLDRDAFNDLLGQLITMRSSRLRSVRVALAVFLAKLRLGLSNRVLACLFRLTSKRSVSRICHQVRVAIMQDFVPYHVGFQHVSRETILTQHQTTVATELVTNGPDQDGYIVSSLEPFFTDSKNNDAAILKHCMLNNEQQVLSWLRDNDVLVLDRGFRDTVNTLNRLGLKVAMPDFLHNQQQLPADEANRTRLVTKNRWVIESVNRKIKTWKFMAQTIQNSTLRFISDYLDIICALINKYQCTAVKDITNGSAIAIRMRQMLTTENRLQERLTQHNGATSLHWSKYNASEFQFPPLTEDNIRDLTFGSYQIRMAKSYIIEHIRQSQKHEEMEFIVERSDEHDHLVRARFQSRHSNNKNHIATVQFKHNTQQPIDAWYCTCFAGAREVGMCSHITALVWHLGVNRAVIPAYNHPLSASQLLDAIDDSMHFTEDDSNSDADNVSSLNESDTDNDEDDLT